MKDGKVHETAECCVFYGILVALMKKQEAELHGAE